MEVVSGLEAQSIPWLPSLVYDAVTFGADPKTEYKVWSVIKD